MNAVGKLSKSAAALEPSEGQSIAQELAASLSLMKAAYARYPAPTAEERIDRLNRLQNAIIEYRDRLVEAVDADFGGRAAAETLLIELLPILEGIHYNRKHLRSWMRQSYRSTPLMLLGARAKVHYQPLGVVGIVVPWNFPIYLGHSPQATGQCSRPRSSRHEPANSLRK